MTSWPARLTVPALDAEDLACADLQVDAPDRRLTPVVAGLQTADLEDRTGRMRYAPVHGQLHLTADHELSEVVLVGCARQPFANDPAPPDDGDPVGDLEDLVQLVTDEDDAVAFAREASEDPEDLFGLLWGQHCGRFVED